MDLIRCFKVSAMAAAMAFGTAQAAVVTAATSPLNFSWSYAALGYAPGPLTGAGSMAVSGFGTNLLTLTITLTNNTASAETGSILGKDAVLYSFGFGIEPNADSVAFVDADDGGMADAVLNTGNAQGNDTIPSLQGIEVCAFGQNNCSGGSANSGIWGGGKSDTFTINLAGTWGDSVDIAPIGFKYQTSAGSYEFTSGSSGGPPSGIPEPGSAALALLALGLMGAGYRARTRARGTVAG